MPTRKQLISSGAEVTPLTREEMYIANALGGEYSVSPLTPAEIVMDNVAKNGGITPTGTIAITQNGEGIDVAQYANADVNVPNPSTGSLNITENGTYDVTDKASAVVNVSGGAVTLGSATVENTATVTGNAKYQLTVRQIINNNGSISQSPLVIGATETKDVGVLNSTAFDTYLEFLCGTGGVMTITGATNVFNISDRYKVVGVKSGDTISVAIA